MDKKVILMILDGWGEGRQDESNVIYSQGAPYIESLRKDYPMATLTACDVDLNEVLVHHAASAEVKVTNL